MFIIVLIIILHNLKLLYYMYILLTINYTNIQIFVNIYSQFLNSFKLNIGQVLEMGMLQVFY